MTKLKNKMPKKGQFIVVWEHNGSIWSDTLKYDSFGVLQWFSTDSDDWVVCTDPVFYEGRMYVKL